MRIIFSQISVILIAIFLTSCWKSDKQIRKERIEFRKEKNNKLETNNKKAINNLAQKYNAVSDWDTLGQYTYLYQEIFINQKKLIAFEGELNDIIKLDSIYYLKVINKNYNKDILAHYDKGTLAHDIKNILAGYNNEFLAQISISNQNFVELEKILKLNKHKNNGCFIFKVSNIFSVCPQLKSDIIEYDKEEHPDSEPDSYLTYGFDKKVLIFHGQLIDFYINETAKEIEY